MDFGLVTSRQMSQILGMVIFFKKREKGMEYRMRSQLPYRSKEQSMELVSRLEKVLSGLRDIGPFQYILSETRVKGRCRQIILLKLVLNVDGSIEDPLRQLSNPRKGHIFYTLFGQHRV